jgi:hypothetical protein
VARSSLRATAGVAAAILTVLALPAVTQAAPPRAVAPSVTPLSIWAWVVARQPSVASYTPSAVNRGNSSGGTNHVTRSGPGQYEVLLPGVGESNANEGGMVHVTALDPGAHNCAVGEWNPGTPTTDEVVDVACRDKLGHFADSAFSLNWVDPVLDDGALAYVWIQTASTGAIDPYYAFNSSGGTNSVTRTASGRYVVRFPGMDGTKGDVQVTAYSSTATCHTADWHAQASDTVVDVQCRQPNGVFADSEFDASYLFHLAFQGQEGASQAFLLADQPHTASYHPALAQRFSSAGLASTVNRIGTGVYDVLLPGMPAGGSVQVTAYGPGKQACRATSIRTQTPQQVGVRCTHPDGTDVDSAFTLAYTH